MEGPHIPARPGLIRVRNEPFHESGHQESDIGSGVMMYIDANFPLKTKAGCDVCNMVAVCAPSENDLLHSLGNQDSPQSWKGR